MIGLIVPPIVIVILVAFLIVVLARTIQNADRIDHRQSFSEPEILEVSRSRAVTSFVTQKTHAWKGILKGMAHRRSIKAAVVEARMEREDTVKKAHDTIPSPTRERSSISQQEKSPTAEDATVNSGMSRMGEIILSYHQSLAEGDNMDAYDPVEIRLIQGIEQNPQDPQVYELLGDFYMDRENYEDARVCYKYVLRLDPRHRRAQEAMRALDRLL